MDYKLKFPSEATGRQLLGDALDANRHDENGGTVLACFTHDHAINLIGTINLPPEEEGGEPVTLDGWHADLRLLTNAPLPESLAPYVVTPQNPAVVWA